MPTPRAATLRVLAAVASLAACTHEPLADGGATRPSSSPTIVEPDVPLAVPTPRFWVADGGVHAYDFDGKRVATFAEVGDYAMRLADGRVVVLVESEPDALSLIVLDPTGVTGPAIRLPNAVDLDHCTGAHAELDADDSALPLRIQSDRDYSINTAGTHACVTLLDRNENMASYVLELAVELDSGAIESQVAFDEQARCYRNDALSSCVSHATTRLWVEGIDEVETFEAWPVRYDGATGLLRRGDATIAELCPPVSDRGVDFDPEWECAQIEDTSSTGRWQLIAGATDMGDYIYRDLYLLDRNSGALQSLDCEGGAGCELREASIAGMYSGQNRAYSAPGEADIGTLPNDRLWIEGMLVIPERGEVVRVGGRRIATVDSPAGD